MLGTRATATWFLFAAPLGCGGSVVFIEDGETSGGGGPGTTVTVGGGFDCASVSFDLDVPAKVCTEGSEKCDLVGLLPDGRSARESCDGTTLQCSLYIDDVLTCTCPGDRIDFASVCPNSVPTCSDWRVNWATAEICSIH